MYADFINVSFHLAATDGGGGGGGGRHEEWNM